jgi:uncharacterized protein YcbK (DUF882 family)
LNFAQRRRCVRIPVLLAALLGASLLPTSVACGDLKPAVRAYRLRLYHTHTGEHLDIIYRRGDQYLPEALNRLDHFLRDYRTGTVHHYDPRVFDLLHDLGEKVTGGDPEINVVCGYRTPWSNEYLREHGHGVALHSLHMQAMAIDIRIPGVDTATLRDAALAMHRGGVGYYAQSQFVHVDVGRVRRW